MASQFVETIMAQALAARDPEVKATTEFLHAQSKETLQGLKRTQAETVAYITELYMKAVADSAPPAVINAYEKLLGSVED